MAWFTDRFFFTVPSRRIIDPAEIVMHGLYSECPFELATLFRPPCWAAEKLSIKMESEELNWQILWNFLGIKHQIECVLNYLLPYYPVWVRYVFGVVLVYAATGLLWALAFRGAWKGDVELSYPTVAAGLGASAALEVAREKNAPESIEGPARQLQDFSAVEQPPAHKISRSLTSEGTDPRCTGAHVATVPRTRTTHSDINPGHLDNSKCPDVLPRTAPDRHEELFRNLKVDDCSDKGPIYHVNYLTTIPRGQSGPLSPKITQSAQFFSAGDSLTSRPSSAQSAVNIGTAVKVEHILKPDAIRAWREFYRTLNENLATVLGSDGADDQTKEIKEISRFIKHEGKAVNDIFETIHDEAAPS